MDKNEILQKAQEVFFRALLAGYASENKENVKVSVFGFKKTVTYTEGEFTVIDEWTTTDNSDVSFGTTTILFMKAPAILLKAVPIWFMSYEGQYPKKVISFLKKALASQYKKREFLGGRGPRFFKSNGLGYMNVPPNYPNENTDFSCFRGRESIFVLETAEELGFHEYRGRSML